MTETVFAVAGVTVVIDETGRALEVRHPSRPERSYLSVALPEVMRRIDGRRLPLDPVPTRRLIDADEHELTLSDPSGIELTVRQMFVAGWQTRCVLANEGTEPVAIEVGWPFELPADAIGWAVTDGAEAAFFAQPDDGRGPLLLGRLRQGSITSVAGGRLRTPLLELPAGARYVLAWDWSWLPEPAEYVRRWPSLHPAAATVVRGGVVALPAGPDVATVVPDGIALERDDELIQLGAADPRTADVELRSARGVVSLRLCWTPSAAELLAETAAGELARPPGPRGVIGLPGLDAAVVVQYALGAELVDDPDAAGDALDQFTARWDAGRGTGGRVDAGVGGLFLCGEYERSRDQSVLDLAVETVLAADHPEPGLGIAGSRICAALVAAGRSPGPVLHRLVALAARPAPEGALAAVLELRMVTQPTVPGAATDGLLGPVLALGTRLGSALPGGPVVPPPTDVLGQLLAIFATLPDALAEPTRRAWGVPAADLAARLVPTLIAALADRPTGRGHVWLTLLAENTR